jgi:hypothetical protein
MNLTKPAAPLTADAALQAVIDEEAASLRNLLSRPLPAPFQRGEVLIMGDELVTFEMERNEGRCLVRTEAGAIVAAHLVCLAR